MKRFLALRNTSFANVSEEDRNQLPLDFAARAILGEQPDLDDKQSDGPLLKEAMEHLQSELKVLNRQGMLSSGTDPSFRRIINRCYAIRIVAINPKSKDGRRLREFKCDACGRKEKNCPFAIDVCGDSNDQDAWNSNPEGLTEEFEAFHEEYERVFTTANSELGLLSCDMGRFYVGKTCLCKTQLTFLTSTTVQDLLYDMFERLKGIIAGVPEDERDDPSLIWSKMVTQENTSEFSKLRNKIRECIAKSGNIEPENLPELKTDDSFWSLIDKHRAMAARMARKEVYQIVRKRSISSMASNEAGASNEGCFTEVEDDDDDEDDVEDEEYDEEEEDEASHSRKQKMPIAGGKQAKRRVVIDDDDEEEEEEEEEEEVVVSKKALGKRPVGGGGGGGGGVRRSTRMRRSPDFLVVSAPTQDDEDDDEDEVPVDDAEIAEDEVPVDDAEIAEASEPPEAPASTPGSMMMVPRPRTSNASAASIATSLRIPAADGAPGVLGSRKNALLDLMDVQRALMADGNFVLSAKLSRSILTFQELLELRAPRDV